jgi:hypothetical protein
MATLYRCFVLVFITIYGIVFLQNCRQTEQKSSTSEPISLKATGKELSELYCTSCHSYPSPLMLDKTTWQKSVLPNMRMRLGLESDMFATYLNYDIDELNYLNKAGVYSDTPVLSQTDWQKIEKYYIDTAPVALKQPIDKVPQILQNFSFLKSKTGSNIANVSMVKFDTTNKQIIAGIYNKKNYLVKYNYNLVATDSLKTQSNVTDYSQTMGYNYMLLVGHLRPSDKRNGSLIKIQNNNEQIILLDSLQRPVDQVFADINNDGSQDVLICEFGNELGKVMWYDLKNNKKHLLSDLPGARRAIITDMNNDNIPDIVLLLSQGNEQIVIFYGKGKGFFTKKTIVKFAPMLGSSHIEIADIDTDGKADIIHTAGDNADLSVIKKPYHGLRIFKNYGNGVFKQSFFYHLDGATKALVRDFDNDKLPDIAVISYFDVYKKSSNKSFVMLKQNADHSFTDYYLPKLQIGKWLVMDAADIDNDGDTDIVLGSNLQFGNANIPEQKAKQYNELVLLKNNTIP